MKGGKRGEKKLRDHLAVERTQLANERTFLSYLRTGLAFAGGGLFLLKFFEESQYSQAAWMFIVAGALFVIYGSYRFHKFSRHIAKEEKNAK